MTKISYRHRQILPTFSDFQKSCHAFPRIYSANEQNMLPGLMSCRFYETELDRNDIQKGFCRQNPQEVALGLDDSRRRPDTENPRIQLELPLSSYCRK